MKEIRRYYAGEQLSATKLNDLVDALRCLCSEAKKLQKTRFTYGAQPINAERRYWASSAGGGTGEGEPEVWGAECVCIGEQCIGTCRAAFEIIKWGEEEKTYITPGAMWNGFDLDQEAWSVVCTTQKPLYVKDGGYYTREEADESPKEGERVITGWGVRNGILIIKDGQPTHRGGGSYVRGEMATGYGAVTMSNVGRIRVTNLPYHLMSGGVDSWVGGRMAEGVEYAQGYHLCNAIKVYNGTIEALIPEWRTVCGRWTCATGTYPVLFTRGGPSGIPASSGACWMMLEELADSGSIPCYNKSGVRFWFCMGVTSTYLRDSGYVEVKWNGATGRCNDCSWEVLVPVAHAFRNIYSGYVQCPRILEEEVIIQPTVYVTAPGGDVVLGAGTTPMTEIIGLETSVDIDGGCVGGAKADACVQDALWVGLPKTISKQRFFPWGNVCCGFYTWEGCTGEEPEV